MRLRALISQEEEVEQAKAQELTLKKVIEDPTAGEVNNREESACKALIKAGEIPAPRRVPVPVPPQPQSLSKTKGIKSTILL